MSEDSNNAFSVIFLYFFNLNYSPPLLFLCFMPLTVLENSSKLSCKVFHILDLSYHFLMIKIKMLGENTTQVI